jgi:ABC-2 type transport system permease protein
LEPKASHRLRAAPSSRSGRFVAARIARCAVKSGGCSLAIPWLLSQMMMQVLYVLPIGVVLWRGQGANGSVATAVAPLVVVVASQLSASLAWLTLAGEDAPELLAVAPVTRRQVERAKLEAIAIPVALIASVPSIWLARYSPIDAGLSLVFGAAAAICTALINPWHPVSGRSTNLRRRAQSKLIGLIEHLMSFLWAVSTGLALYR